MRIDRQHRLAKLAGRKVRRAIKLASQLIVFPAYGIDVPLSTNIAIGAWFTGISIARSYVLRRWFNGLMLRGRQ